MEFDFKRDLCGKPTAKFSMDHEVIGKFFTEELPTTRQIENILLIITKIETRECSFKEYRGHDFQLSFNPRGVEISALSLDADFDGDWPEDSDYYDQESFAECGLEDFKLALVSWLDYIN